MWTRATKTDTVSSWQEFERDDLLATLHVHVFCAYRSRLGPAWSCQRSCDSRSRLYFVHGGAGELRHHDGVFRLRPGGLYLLPAGTPHDHRCQRRLDLSWCHFAATLHTGLDLFARMQVPFELRPAAAARVPDLFADLIRLYHDDSLGAVLRRSGLLLQLLALFLEQADMAAWNRWHTRAAAFAPALAEIERRLHEPIAIAELAQRLHRHPATFTRAFKAALGVAPHQYQLRRRIEAAQLALAQGDDKLETIGTGLGFGDAFHFSRVFKKITGLAPARYRELIRSP
jgi:AraC-like DNA-binding protein